MKKSVLIISVLLFLMFVPMVLAVTTTTINVKTLSNHKVILKTLDPNPSEDKTNLLEYFKNTTDNNGIVSFKSNTKMLIINIVVIVEKDGIRKEIGGLTVHTFEEKVTGGIINLNVEEKTKEEKVQELLREQSNEEESNETKEGNETTEIEGIDVQVEITNQTEGVEEESETKTTTEKIKEEKAGGKITGAIINRTKTFVTSKITYYIIGGILIVGILFFVFSFTLKKIKSKKGRSYIDFKIKPNNDKEEELDNKIEEHDDKLEDAEKKLQEAKQELDEIKNRKARLQEAKEKFEKAKADLKRFED